MNTESPTSNRPKILIFDDEAPLVEALAYMLLKNGYQPLIAASRAECFDLMRTAHPNLVLLDLFLPIEKGLEICREICRQRAVPLIMLTTQASEDDCIQGLELCADDYVVKPFSMALLLARIRSVLRRSQRREIPPLPPVNENGFVIVPETREVTVRGQRIILAAKQFRLLHFLATHPDCVLSRADLIQEVWGDMEDREVTLTSVDVYVRQLRELIELDASQPRHIQTVRRRGYYFSFDKETSAQ